MTRDPVNTKQKILTTATELFLEKGVDRVGVREIATKAGINLSLMNYYFHTKEKLFESIFEMLLRDKAAIVRDILESDLSIEDKIGAYTSTYIDIIIGKPVLVSFALSVIHRNPEKIKTMGAILAFYNSEIFCNQLMVESKQGKIKIVDPEQLYISLISLILFPFAVRELIIHRNSFTQEQYHNFVNERKKHITEMLLSYLKP